MTKDTSRGTEAWPAGQSRNAPCPCGSGKKYKQCHGALGAGPADDQVANMPAADPKAAQKQFLRGVKSLKSGQVQAAMPLLLEAMQMDPTHFDAHLALGSALIASGRFADASQILARAVSLRPDSPEAWRDLGIAYDRQSLHEHAMEAFRRAVELEPKLKDTLTRLGELYVMYSRMEEASDIFERAADLNSNNTNSRLLRSDAHLLRGDMPGAEQWARNAVAVEPGSAAAHGMLGSLLYAQGRFDEAAESYENSLRLDPGMVRCWLGLTQCRKFTANDRSVLNRIFAILQRGDLNEADRATLHFALGKIYDDGGDYANAMEQFDAANRLRAKDLRFDRARFAALVDRNIRYFTKDFIASCSALAVPDPKPLFIVGMYRSGTTLVEQIISSHPDVAAGDELTVWGPADLELDFNTGKFDPNRVRPAIAKYLSVLRNIGPSAARVTDKLPFNCFRLGAIHALLPNARIIHCLRDPIDTCLSIYSNQFRARVNFAARKDDLAFAYRQYLRMMDHWREVLPAERFMEVQYERLIADREAETRRLIAFAGLEWNDKCLRPEENTRSINTASAWQARQPVYATSMQRWKRYEPWLGELRQLVQARDGS